MGDGWLHETILEYVDAPGMFLLNLYPFNLKQSRGRHCCRDCRVCEQACVAKDVNSTTLLSSWRACSQGRGGGGRGRERGREWMRLLFLTMQLWHICGCSCDIMHGRVYIKGIILISGVYNLRQPFEEGWFGLQNKGFRYVNLSGTVRILKTMLYLRRYIDLYI